MRSKTFIYEDIVKRLTNGIKQENGDEIDKLTSSKKHTIKVSIIVPVHNSEKYLECCLDSLISQTLNEIEIICVNDGSEDRSSAILNIYKMRDSRIQVIDNKKNLGSSATRNIGLSLAVGKYIGFVDSDDYVSKNYFEDLYYAAEFYGSEIAASSNCFFVKDERIVGVKDLGIKKFPVIRTIEDKGKIVTTSGVCWNKIYRRDFINNNHIQSLEIRNAGEDNFFTACTIILAQCIATEKDSVYYYRLHKSSQTQRLRDKTHFSVVDVYKEIDTFIDKYINQKQDRFSWHKVLNKRKMLDYRYFIKGMDYSERHEFCNVFTQAFPECCFELIVSLTSYPARINTVWITIESLLNQTMVPDHLILWLAESEFSEKERNLPSELLKLCSKGLEIRWCEDIKSYKKLIPTLTYYPDAVVVTADDDVIYDKNWLKILYEGYLEHPKDIQCHRAHKAIVSVRNFYILPYNLWQTYDVYDDINAYYSVFLTGSGGVLYPPHSLSRNVFNISKIRELCMYGDDIWFWANAILKGTKIRLVLNAIKNPIIIEGTQDTALWIDNLCHERNDIQIHNVLKAYPLVFVRIWYEALRSRLNI